MWITRPLVFETRGTFTSVHASTNCLALSLSHLLWIRYGFFYFSFLSPLTTGMTITIVVFYYVSHRGWKYPFSRGQFATFLTQSNNPILTVSVNRWDPMTFRVDGFAWPNQIDNQVGPHRYHKMLVQLLHRIIYRCVSEGAIKCECEIACGAQPIMVEVKDQKIRMRPLHIYIRIQANPTPQSPNLWPSN